MENRNSSEYEIMDLEGLSLLESELARVNQHIERMFQVFRYQCYRQDCE